MPKRNARKPVRRTDAKLERRPKGDGYKNTLTGLGTRGRDKLRGGPDGIQFHADVLDRVTLEELWRGSDMAARVVELIPDEMLRERFEVSIAPSSDDGTEGSAEVVEEFPGSTIGGGIPNTNSNPVVPPPVKPPQGTPKKDDDGSALVDPPVLMAPPVREPKPLPEGDDTTKAQNEGLIAKLEELRAFDLFLEALYYQRAYGGAGILVGADDGATDLRTPLDLSNIRSVDWLTVLTPRELFPVAYYNDPRAAKFGEPAIYRVLPEGIPIAMQQVPPQGQAKMQAAQFVEAHESRLLIFQGIKVSRMQIRVNNGWGDTVLNRANKVLEHFDLGWDGAAQLLADFSQAVIGIKGLAEMFEANDDQAVLDRFTMIDMSRSMARAIVLDSEETFERKPTPMSGLPETLDRFASRLAAATGIPVPLLMGEAPAGLNATGDSSIRFFYDKIRALQHKVLLPRVERLVRLLMLSATGPTDGKEPEVWSVEFPPLWQMTEAESADLRFKQAQTDQIYISENVVTPEEIAASRFGGDKWSSKTVIDFAGRKKMAALGPALPPGGAPPAPPKPGAVPAQPAPAKTAALPAAPAPPVKV